MSGKFPGCGVFLIELLGKSYVLYFLLIFSNTVYRDPQLSSTKKNGTRMCTETFSVTGLSLRYACLPNQIPPCFNDCTTVELPVYILLTFDKKQRLIFQLCTFSSGNSNNECPFCNSVDLA